MREQQGSAPEASAVLGKVPDLLSSFSNNMAEAGGRRGARLECVCLQLQQQPIARAAAVNAQQLQLGACIGAHRIHHFARLRGHSAR